MFLLKNKQAQYMRTLKTKLYNELGIESIKLRQWFRRLLFFKNTIEWFTSIFK